MAGNKTGAIKRTAAYFGMSQEEYLGRIESGQRHCIKCKQWLPLSNFGKDRSRPDGLAYRCHGCRRAKIKKTTKGRVSTFKGRSHTPEARLLIAKARKGNTDRVGKKHTLETRQKISRICRERAPRGPDCPSYKDGKCAERHHLRLSTEYIRWRFDVYMRDKFTCQECGDSRGGNLNAHHIKAFADYPELRFELSNGITLCEECHKQYGNKGSVP